MKVTGIVAVHNEEKYLPYSLRPLNELKLHELIFVIDNCTDNSEEIVRSFVSKRGGKITHFKEHKWYNRAFETLDFGAQQATGDFIYFLGADIIVDPAIFDPNHWDKSASLKFRFFNYDLYGHTTGYAYEKTVFRILGRFGFAREQCFIEAFKRDHWLKTRHENPPEDLIGFLKAPREVLKHTVTEQLTRDFKCITTVECLHLRPRLTEEQQLLRGVARYVLKYPLWKVILHAVLLHRVYILVGYFHAKYHYREMLDKLTTEL